MKQRFATWSLISGSALVLLGACSGAEELDDGADRSVASGGADGTPVGSGMGPTGGEMMGGGPGGHGSVGTGGQSQLPDDDGTGGDQTTGEPSYLPEFCQDLPTAPGAGQWQTSRVFYEDSRLAYPADGGKNRVVDFSYAGYHYGETALAEVAEVERVSPVDGDDTANIQAAIDRAGALPRDAKKMRGMVVLNPGTYEISGQLEIKHSGVVVRGSGQGSDPSSSTILKITGTSTRTAVRLGSGNGNPWSEGAKTNITDDFVQVGSRSFHVENASAFAVGDEVIVRHPSTQAWINAVDGGGTAGDPNWTAGTKDLVWYRTIVGVSGSELFLDAPIYNHLNKSLSQSTVAPMENKAYRTEIGLENLRIDIVTQGGEDEAHAHDAVGVVGVEDAWVKDVTVLHFTHAGIYTQGAVRVTVQGCTAIDPVGIRDGGRFYNYDAESNSNLILFKDSMARDGRHNMIVNGTGSASGIVFFNIDSQSNGSQSEGHRHFSQAMLFDSIYGNTSGLVQLVSRGDWGTEHGWSSVHSVIWNNSGASRVQKPPTAQNYAFSDRGYLDTNYPFGGEGGTGENDIRGSGELFPASLYQAQLCERLSPP